MSNLETVRKALVSNYGEEAVGDSAAFIKVMQKENNRKKAYELLSKTKRYNDLGTYEDFENRLLIPENGKSKQKTNEKVSAQPKVQPMQDVQPEQTLPSIEDVLKKGLMEFSKVAMEEQKLETAEALSTLENMDEGKLAQEFIRGNLSEELLTDEISERVSNELSADYHSRELENFLFKGIPLYGLAIADVAAKTPGMIVASTLNKFGAQKLPDETKTLMETVGIDVEKPRENFHEALQNMMDLKGEYLTPEGVENPVTGKITGSAFVTMENVLKTVVGFAGFPAEIAYQYSQNLNSELGAVENSKTLLRTTEQMLMDLTQFAPNTIEDFMTGFPLFKPYWNLVLGKEAADEAVLLAQDRLIKNPLSLALTVGSLKILNTMPKKFGNYLITGKTKGVPTTIKEFESLANISIKRPQSFESYEMRVGYDVYGDPVIMPKAQARTIFSKALKERLGINKQGVKPVKIVDGKSVYKQAQLKRFRDTVFDEEAILGATRAKQEAVQQAKLNVEQAQQKYFSDSYKNILEIRNNADVLSYLEGIKQRKTIEKALEKTVETVDPISPEVSSFNDLMPSKGISKVLDKLSIDYSLRQFPETARAAKLMKNEMAYWEGKSMQIAKDLVKHYGKDNPDKSYQVLLNSEKVNPNAEYLYGNTVIQKFYRESLAELQKNGINVDWKSNKLIELNDKIKSTIEQVKVLEGELGHKKRIKTLKTEIAELEETMMNLADIEYTHIPVRLWLDKLADAKDPAGYYKSLKFLVSRKRKTVSIEDLTESLISEGLATPADFHYADALVSYGRRIGRDIALAKIFNAAKKEGAGIDCWTLNEKTGKWNIINSKAPENWKMLENGRAGFTKGWAFPPNLYEYFNKYLNVIDSPYTAFDEMLTLVKVGQFIKPQVMVTYDILQSMTTGAIFYPRLWKEAYKVVKDKNELYWDLNRNGLFSKLSATPMKGILGFENSLNMMKKSFGARFVESFGKLKQGDLKELTTPIAKVYAGSWNIAWGLDEYFRTITSLHLMKKGFSLESAAQLAATTHGDYADIPFSTRRYANRLLFTPTFKVAMGKSLAKMVKGAFKYKESPENAFYGSQLARTAAIITGTDLFLTELMGLERIELGRKYSYRTYNEKGEPQDHVFIMPLQYNFYAKNLSALSKLVDPADTRTSVNKFLKANYYEIHPLYRFAYEGLMEPVKFGIAPESADDTKKLGLGLLYITRNYVQLFNLFSNNVEVYPSKANIRRKKDLKDLQKAYGKIGGYTLDKLLYHYTTTDAEYRDLKEAKMLINKMKNYNPLTQTPETFSKESEEWFKRFSKQLHRIIKEEKD